LGGTYIVPETKPASSQRGRLLLALGCGAALALGACRAEPVGENPAGYPPIPRGRAAAPAPTPGGPIPTVVGIGQSPGASKEGEEQRDTGGAGAVGPVAGSSGIYETMSGSGSASSEPTPVPTPTPRPVATVAISRERGFEPAQLTINRGDAILWRNDGRPPQTVTGDPALATDPSRVALPAGAEPWTSPALNHGDSYVRAFGVSGEYAYVSMPFERQGIVGRITVR
jgi:plastocyanin